MYHQACNYQLTPYRVQLFVKARMPLRNHVYCCGPGGAMSQTVMIEALGQGIDARTQELDNVFRWIEPQGIDGRRVLVLLGDIPAPLDLVCLLYTSPSP